MDTMCRCSRWLTVAAVLSMVGAEQLEGQIPGEAWDVTQPRGETREIAFTAEEGTWMSVDISPDGTWIVFDLLGHIYRMPASGGDAVALTQASGIAMNYHPRISPDGREIAFVSDRGGQDNLWVMHADGSNPRLIHRDMDSRIAEPAWTPDGRHLVVTKREKSPSGFYRTHDVIWMFPREGGDGFEAVRLGVSGAAAPARSGIWAGLDRAQWPSVSPDGRYIYFHSSLFAGSDRRLRRLDLETGHVDDITESKGRYLSCCGRPAYPLRLGEVAPEVSPDGRWLAFARKLPGGRTAYRGKEYIGRTALWLRDLETGGERVIMDPITNTLAGHHPSWHTRTLPGYSWASDGESIVLSQGGKIRRLWVETGTVETIPFRAAVRRTISEMARGQVQLDDETFVARALRWPASSPGGARLVFEAIGRLWTMSLPGGTPKPLTAPVSDAFQLTPAWSPDGRWIAYVTWEDGVGGHVWKVRADGGQPERLTDAPGTYIYPNWTEDGASLVVSRWPYAFTPVWDAARWELVSIPAVGGAVRLVTVPGFPARSTIGPGGRLFYLTEGTVHSVAADGQERRDHAKVGSRVGDAIPSPDGRWIAMAFEEDVYVAPLPPGAMGRGAPEISLPASGRRLSRDGGFFPRWRNATTLEFVGANRYFAYHVDTEQMDTVTVRLEIDRDVATGVIAFVGARIITLDDRAVVEQGTILVRDGRITCVGECDASGADRVMDVQGKTIMPGWVDVHAHHLAEDGRLGLIPQHRSTSARYLAYGVTTVHDPAAPTVHSFTVGELIAAGRMVGPRSYSAGTHLTCGQWSPLRPIRTLEDAQHHVNRLADLGAISIKDYKQCTRIQRTWLAEAARRRGVTLTSEGSDLGYLLGLIMTGHAGWEHTLQYVPVYSDVTMFFGQAGAHYSAQLFISDYPTGNAIEYWFGERDLWEDHKLMQWSPWQETAARRSFVKKPAREFMFPIIAEAAADMKRAGAYLAMGAHGEQDGLGSHWETWSYAEGLTPMEALEAASLDGAHFLGMENEIGSISAGKLADLVVLNANPLDNIRNTTDIVYVMKAGRLYDANTLDELWPRQRPYGVQPWVVVDVLRTDLRPDDYWDKRSERRATRR